MDTNFLLLLSIDNKYEKISKNMKFRYFYLAKVRNHGTCQKRILMFYALNV